MERYYDYIIVGGGLSGLLLARAMIDHGLLADRQLGIIESRPLYSHDRFWSVWDVDNSITPDLVVNCWHQLELHTTADSITINSPVPYRTIDSSRFYDKITSLIDTHENAELELNIQVDDLKRLPNDDILLSLSTDETITAGQVFDSRPPQVLPEGPYDLLQHFKGVHIKVDDPVFDPSRAVLMDFRTDQQWGIHFDYILPFSSTEALIETTWFNKSILDKDIYDEMIRMYLEDCHITSYEVVHEEQGIIPMSTNIEQPRSWSSVLDIGTRGGQTRPSTGYTFLHAQRYARQVVDELLKPEEKRQVPVLRSKWKTYVDEILLRVLSKQPEVGPAVFSQLFRRNRPERMIDFLSGTSTFWDDLVIMTKVPHKWAFFKQAMFGFFNRLGPW